MPKPTPEQEKIISAGRSNILVSAAAGSGKTTVLSDRITTKIVNKEIEIDQILVATFTNDAAANMREKIEECLKKALMEDGADRKYIKTQLDKLPSAYIQTMNSFCNRVVNEAAHMSDDDNIMDPGSTVLDETTLNMLRNQAAMDAILARYNAIAEDELTEQEREDFLNLMFSMGNGKSEGAIADAMESAYKKLRALPNYIEILDGTIRAREDKDASGEITGLDRYFEMMDKLFSKVLGACTSSDPDINSLGISEDHKVLVHNIVNSVRTHFTEFYDQYDPSESDSSKLDKIHAFFKSVYDDPHPNFYPRLYEKGTKDPDFLDEFGPVAFICMVNRRMHQYAGDDTLKSAAWGYTESSTPYDYDEGYRVFEKYDYKTLFERQLRRTSCARAFVALLKDMDVRLGKLKKALRGIDFSDQEHMCLRVLNSASARDLYKYKFKEIYIDEYQDNTSLQDTVIAQIANDNVFCVGDVKQSIYKFRNANPSMFIRKADSYRNDSSKGNLMGLSCNFRSTPQILYFVNEIFSQLMSGDAAEIDYDGDDHKLVSSPIAKDGPIPEVILVNAGNKGNDVVDDEGDIRDIPGIELLITEVKNKVDEYLSKGYDYNDIFVLTRTNKVSQAIAEYLRVSGIAARCEDETPMFKDREITGICNLISVLANEYRDECLTGVLLSPYRFSNFNVDELAEIISFEPELKYMNLIVKVKNYSVNGTDENIRNRCSTFIDSIDNLRSESVIRDVGELVETIYDETGIKRTLKKESPNQVKKLSVFKNWLCDVFLKRDSDITDLATVIEQMQSRLKDDASISIDIGGENLVRCMTYHKSKGLQRKCVIIADVDGSGRGNSDINSYVNFRAGNVLTPDDPQGPGIVVDDYDDDSMLAESSPEKAVAKEESKLADTAETMRLLYVALTRAEENLCFIGRVDLSADKQVNNVYKPILDEDKYLSRDYYLKCSGIAQLMLSALLRMKATDDSSNLELVCGLARQPRYVSDFDQVRIQIKSVDSMAEDGVLDLSGSSDSSDNEESSDAAEIDSVVYGLAQFDENGRPEFKPYRFEDAMKAPAKTSVSAMKRDEEILYSKDSGSLDSEGEDEPELKVAINMIVPDIESYLNDKDKISGAALGTAVHKMMSFIDLVRLSEDSSYRVKDELDALVNEGILTSRERDAVAKFEDHVRVFVDSSLGKALAAADKEGRAEREKSLVCALRINPDRSDYTLVQGTLDAMYIDESGEATIIDYKTDYLKTDDSEEIRKIIKERHGGQLELYAAAVMESGIKVKKRYIVLLRKNMVIEV